MKQRFHKTTGDRGKERRPRADSDTLPSVGETEIYPAQQQRRPTLRSTKGLSRVMIKLEASSEPQSTPKSWGPVLRIYTGTTFNKIPAHPGYETSPACSDKIKIDCENWGDNRSSQAKPITASLIDIDAISEYDSSGSDNSVGNLDDDGFAGGNEDGNGLDGDFDNTVLGDADLGRGDLEDSGLEGASFGVEMTHWVDDWKFPSNVERDSNIQSPHM
ncbi:hypothetical protein TWF481_002812 [Arthrobotrys musiformis]|uniref:Uncharacterized protein n=1 Tax=Arthrobotrys musiformis TaxID=47236 RepID=A0AAV9VRF5_9PEZI